jgi:anti-sigma factor RsiW
MKKIPQELRNKILGYIDNTLSDGERKSLELELAHDPALHALYQDMKNLHHALDQLPAEEPSKNFTQVLMNRLHNASVHNRITLRNGIFLLTGVLIAVVMASVLLAAGVFDNATAMLNPNDLEFTQQYLHKTLPSFSINLKLMINAIIVLNLGLAWIVLDRTVLKPFFQKRWQNYNN